MLNLLEKRNSKHIHEICAYFGAELDEGNDACTIKMDNDKAKGFISSYELFEGLTVWVYNIEFYSKFQVELDLSPDGPIYFSYNVKGNFSNTINKSNDLVNILQNQNMIIKGSPNNSVTNEFPANTKLEIAVVIIDVELLGSLQIRNAKRMHLSIKKIFRNIPQDQPYRYLGDINAETAKYASIICENNNTTLVGELLTEGAVLNMMASQIKAYEQDLKNESTQSTLTTSELSKISSLGDHIINNIESKITIIELSKHFGLSPKKLQIGIRHLYGDSVGHYILNLRMGQAKYLLNTTDFNISEICNRVGLTSKSYFTKVFKNRFGMLPSKWRR